MNEFQAPLGDVLDAPQASVGERLHRARVEKKLELADIAQETRVPLRHLTAIETDTHDSLPALTYTIGFVRTFARYVGLPQDEIAAQFKAETSKTAHVPQTMPMEPLDESRLPPRGVVAASSAGVILIVAGLWAWGTGMFQGDLPPPPSAEVAAVSEPAADQVVSADAAMEQPLVSADAATPVGGDIGVPPPAPMTMPATDASQPPVAGAAGPVVITATEEVWIKVYDSAERKTVKMGILAPGETYQVPAGRDDLLLWTGRAGALRLSVGGRPVPALGGPRDTVQDVSLAPSALLARGG